MHQQIWYQMDNVDEKIQKSNVIIESPMHKGGTSPSQAPVLAIAGVKSRNHNMNIEYLNDGSVKKIREDVVIIPCVEEFNVRARFYTLNKEALTRAFSNEDFRLRIDLDVRAACGIEILDMFLICVSCACAI